MHFNLQVHRTCLLEHHLLSFTMVEVGKDPKYEVYFLSFGTEHWYYQKITEHRVLLRKVI